jgi:hypothetical protein
MNWMPMLKIDVDIPHKRVRCRHQNFLASAPVDADIPHVSVRCRHQFFGIGTQLGAAFIPSGTGSCSGIILQTRRTTHPTREGLLFL